MNNDLKRNEKIKAVWAKLRNAIPWLILATIGFFVVNEWRIPGVAYSSHNWTDTMTRDEYVKEFNDSNIAEQLAPDTITTVDGAPLDQLYNCYEYLGGYNDPILRPVFEQLGQPIIWTGDDLPAMSEFGTYDLTGKQLRLYVNGTDVFTGFECPPNAHLMRDK